jgi:hypothetical protein
MTRKYIWLIALAMLFVLGSGPASACKVVGYRNGEPLCATTSDGRGQQYTDGRSAREKHLAALRARLALERQKRRVIRHQGANW